MRILVPMIAGLSLLISFSWGSYADVISLDDVLNQTTCSGQQDEPKQTICGYVKDTACRDGVQGCSGNSGSRLPDLVDFSTASDATVDGQMATFRDGASKLYDVAQKCCNPTNSGAGCPTGFPKPNIPAKNGGMKEIAEDRATKVDQFGTNSIASGACQARAKICQLYTQKAYDGLQKAINSSSCTNCSSKLGDVKQLADACNRLADPYGNVVKYDWDGIAQDDKQIDNTQGPSNPEGGPSKGGPNATNENPTQKKTSGGLGGINPMSLMQAMQGLMNQNQNQQTPPQTPQITPCDPSSSNGAVVCGSGMAAAPAGGSDSWNKQGSGGDMQTASADHGGFNPASIKDRVNPNLTTAGDPVAAKPGKAQTVANGGGQMLGGGGGTQPASLGGSGGGSGGAMGVHGSVADIDHGFQGRSPFAAQVQAMDASAGGGGGGWSGYGRDSLDGVPLADFLPFHKYAPRAVMRGLAGGNARNIQIQSKDVNIWNRISAHILERCNKGLLRDCIP